MDPSTPVPEPDAGAKTAFTRRGVLTAAGASLIAAAVLAACGDDGEALSQSGQAPTTTGLPARTVDDAVLLRTCSSLEHLIVETYDQLIGLGVLKDPLAQNVTLLRAHHDAQAKRFESTTTTAGGQPFTEANPVIKKNVVDPGIKLIKDNGNKPNDVASFMHGLEELAAGTYQSFVPQLTKPQLRQSVMSVGAISARQAAAVAKTLDNGKVAPGQALASTATSTTAAATGTSAAGGGPTTTAPAAAAPVYQVPGAFGSLAQISVTLGTTELVIDLPGPNSYMYP